MKELKVKRISLMWRKRHQILRGRYGRIYRFLWAHL